MINCKSSLGTCSVNLDNAVISYVYCNLANNCVINILNNPKNPTISNCGGLPAMSKIDCTSATNCIISIKDSIADNTMINCKSTTCSNTF